MPAPTRPRALFFGTPEFAVPCLDALVAIADVVRVVSQPDRPSGRGLALTPTPVKARATALGIPVMQPTKVKPPELHAELRALEADVAVVVAYGRILPAGILTAPRRGCVNVHASLLPRWRGAAPIQWAVASGDRETGVCLMEMDEGLDTGPVFARAVTAIGADETAGELFARLSREGAALLQRELPRWLAGELRAEAQVGEPTIARLLEKRDGEIDFAWDAQRGIDPGTSFATKAGGRFQRSPAASRREPPPRHADRQRPLDRSNPARVPRPRNGAGERFPRAHRASLLARQAIRRRGEEFNAAGKRQA